MKWRKDKPQPKDASWVFSTKPIPRWNGETHSLLVTSKEASPAALSQADVVCSGGDDAVEIQAAVNRLGAVQGELLIMDGTFLINKPILHSTGMKALVLRSHFKSI